MSTRVIVVGAGLAGLVAARHLAAGGTDVTVLERRESVGGRVRSRERQGFRLDRGFQVLFTAYPAVQRELDLEALDLRRFAPGAIVAAENHRSTLADPLRDPQALPATLTNPNVSVGDALRVARLRLAVGRSDPETIFEGSDESIASFLADRGFSDRFVDRFLAPFYGGITLDRSLSTSSHVFEYTFRALATGSTAVPAAGMAAVPAQLADRVREAGGDLETGVAVESVSSEGDGATVTTADGTSEVNAVVVATDPPTARRLTGVDGIPTAGRGCVTQYYRLPESVAPETGKRLLLNADGDAVAAGREPNHVVPHGEVAPEYAPDDETLLGAVYLEARGESTDSSKNGDASDSEAVGTGNAVDSTAEPTVVDADDATLAERTRRTLESWYPERRFDALEHLHTDRIPFAQFAQPPGIHDDLPDVRDPDGPVYLAGEVTRWSSIQGAMESGRQAARAVIEDRSAGSTAGT
ncbi:NAD(P)/FAD-dependent oxidoreductase [Halopiger goleimassiliensis]|uniref:NAD(P)/FAD-dependent oxidoreductase n=1 Tax=Halopiger goleimassiliensis TaxID=1293048 RepID=UPI000677ABB6|nr:NAD(P)/FAD-dependent oxidoreductase [Halopiger goleimassiliensis]